MTVNEQQKNDLILTNINSLKTGSNKDHNHLISCLNVLLPSLGEMKEKGFSFQHVVKVDNVVISDWKFDMDDIEELERFIDSYTVNEICYGSPEDYDLPEVFDKHSMTEDLLIVQSV